MYFACRRLLVQRETSTIGVTWKDWKTIVGVVEGPLASVALQEESHCQYAGGCCGAVKKFSFARPIVSRQLRWVIEESRGDGVTICFIGLEIDGRWVTDPQWKVTALFHPNGL